MATRKILTKHEICFLEKFCICTSKVQIMIQGIIILVSIVSIVFNLLESIFYHTSGVDMTIGCFLISETFWQPITKRLNDFFIV